MLHIGANTNVVGSGLTKLTPTGTINGTNTVFVFSSAPIAIVSDGVTYFDGQGYTLATLTATMDIAPQGFIYGLK